MPEHAIAQLFDVQHRFLRSVNLERDFADPHALSGYILTPQVKSYATRLMVGLRPESAQRAWRITGDYGSGKSSFALLLAHLLGEKSSHIPEPVRRAFDFRRLGIPRPALLPVLVTGSSQPLSNSLLKALQRDVLSSCNRGRPPLIVEDIRNSLDSHGKSPIPDNEVIRLVGAAVSYVVQAGKGSGLLILVDELGKFLEYGALHPERQDVFLLQALAEVAARSGKTPVMFVGLLHQGFNSYAEQLSQSAQREWEKIAGRFDELLFDQPLEDTTLLIADALHVRTGQIPGKEVSKWKKDMGAIAESGWYGATARERILVEASASLYPIHPTVVPVLVRLFSRFGQNERSLFSFLLGAEPFGLQDFASRSVRVGESFRLYHLYDYARSTFGSRLALQSFRTHWNQIDSLVESFHGNDEIELQILKTVGLLNLVDSGKLRPTDDTIRLAVARTDSEQDQSAVAVALRKLRDKKVLYHRGVCGGYCVWPHTSANLDKAYQDAVKALGRSPQRVTAVIRTYLETQSLVARRHYIETGNLRHFEVHFCPVSDLVRELAFDFEIADGRIIVALCETAEERLEALQFSQAKALVDRPEILIAIPSPLRILGRLVQELQRWQWVASNTPELASDAFAEEEVSRQVTAAKQSLEQRIHAVIGLQRSCGGSELQWFHETKPIVIPSGKELLSFLSTVCDRIYNLSPRIANELVNRRVLSSAAAAARMRLIESIFRSPDKPYLGLDPNRKPPEMAIYLSLLKETGVHRELQRGKYGLVGPQKEHDHFHLSPALDRILEMVKGAEISRVKVSDIFSELRKPPFGIRDGLNPIFLAIFALIHQQHIAFYENGMFMREIGGLDLMRLTKVPEIFEIQYCKLAGIRSDIFHRLLAVLGADIVTRKPDILDVVRPLCIFAAQLPPFAKKTRRVSETGAAIRSALLESREPATLLFKQLPEACGLRPFTVATRSRRKEIDTFVSTLKGALDELKMIYPRLQERMKIDLTDAFGSTENFKATRSSLAVRSQSCLSVISEPSIRAFCNRLSDVELGDAEWLESLGSLLCSTPPPRWADADADRFSQEVHQFGARFKRLEDLAFVSKTVDNAPNAMRICVTRIDGTELSNVVHFGAEHEATIAMKERQVKEILAESGAIGMAAVARAFWDTFNDRGKEVYD